MTLENRSQGIVIGATTIIGLLASLNLWFLNRLVASIDDNTRQNQILSQKVFELDTKVAVLYYALQNDRKLKWGAK